MSTSFAPRLAQTFTVLMTDLRGYGDSSVSSGACSWRRCCRSFVGERGMLRTNSSMFASTR